MAMADFHYMHQRIKMILLYLWNQVLCDCSVRISL